MKCPECGTVTPVRPREVVVKHCFEAILHARSGDVTQCVEELQAALKYAEAFIKKTEKLSSNTR